jgi:hypothetical protein
VLSNSIKTIGKLSETIGTPVCLKRSDILCWSQFFTNCVTATETLGYKLHKTIGNYRKLSDLNPSLRRSRGACKPKWHAMGVLSKFALGRCQNYRQTIGNCRELSEPLCV